MNWDLSIFVVAVAVVLGILAFTGSSCVQATEKMVTERATACLQSGGQWFATRPEMCLRER